MVKIFSDSTCDLSRELAVQYGIDLLPLFVRLGDEEYLDGVTITPDEIYAWADGAKATPKTAACSVELVKEAFRPYLEAGNELVCFAISAQMSASARAMQLAAEELGAAERVTVIDSANLSTGIGLLVLEAAEMAAKGCAAAEIRDHAEQRKALVRSSFVVDTLTYLHRGGRCSGLSALLGGTLKLHPCIVVEDGSMHADKKYRGNMPHVIRKYVEDLTPALCAADGARVFITHSGCSEEIIAMVRGMLEELHCFREIHITRAGGVISSHCGPGTLGVLYMAGE